MAIEDSSRERPGSIFISHASSDALEAQRIVQFLEQEGIACWMAPRDVAPAMDYAEKITSAIAEASALILLYTEHAGKSAHCMREVELAQRQHIPVYPLRMDGAPLTEGYEYRLATVQWIDATANERDALLALIRALSCLARSQAPLPAKARPHAARATDAVHRLRITGRELELRRIDEALDRARKERRGQCLLIHGDSGAGKSILTQYTLLEARRRGFIVASTVCEPFHQGMSFFPIRELIRQLTISGSPILDLTDIYGPRSVEVEMASLTDVENIDPSSRRDGILATFANMVIGRSLAGECIPVVLAIDDLERVDPGTTDSLLCLLARLTEAPVIIVATYRSDIVAATRTTHPLGPLLVASGRSSHTIELPLGMIPRSEMRSLVEAILEAPAQLPPSFFDQLWRETEGNPLYVRELLRSLQDHPAGATKLVFVNGTWQATGDFTNWRTPTSVEDAISYRLDLMDPKLRTELEKASVIGKRFAFALMAELTETGEDTLLNVLEQCVDLALIQESSHDDESFEFTHGKIRDVLYRSMSRIRRRKLHSVVADALQSMRSVLPEDWEALIGEHLYQAGRLAEATPLLEEAAMALLRISAARDASAMLAQGLAAAVGSGADQETLVRLKLATVRALIQASDYPEALRLTVELGQDPSVDPTSGAWAQVHEGEIRWLTGEPAEALHALSTAKEKALQLGDLEMELHVCAGLAELCDRSAEQLSGIDEAASKKFREHGVQYLDRQIVLAENSANPSARARALRNKAKRLRQQGDLDAAVRAYEEGIALTDARVASHTLLISYAKTLRFAGKWAEAQRVVERVLEWSTQSGARRSLAIALHYRALILMEQGGSLLAVRADLEEAYAIHTEINYGRGVWEVNTVRGELCAAQGDWNQALPLFREVLGHPDSMNDASIVAAIAQQLVAINEDSRAERLMTRWNAA
ncbi:ATP-binding protein [Kocuria rhizosphaericola]|uniref:ATP-binding protein n=1 Tax=Kocuria rhizosphaericola TaxID=3376284 RepID=UPI0037A1CD19